MATRDYELKPRNLDRTNSLFGPDYQKQILNAFLERKLATFKNILKSGNIDPNHSYGYPYYGTLLDIVCVETGTVEYVKSLLEYNADINRINDTTKKAPIHQAIDIGDIETIKILINNHNININLMSEGNTPLHSTVKHIEDLDDDREEQIKKYEDIVKILLIIGADANIPDLKNVTPIYSAAKQGLGIIVELILEYSTKPIDLDSYKDRRQQTARQIIKNTFPHLKLPDQNEQNIGVDQNKLFSLLNSNDEMGFLNNLRKVKDKDQLNEILNSNNGYNTLLQYACNNGMDKAVKELLDKGADPNLIAPGSSMKPIAIACSEGFHKILELFIINKYTSFDSINGDSLLQLTIKGKPNKCENPNVDYGKCLESLIKVSQIKSDINFADIKGSTALHYATKLGDHDTILELLRNNAYIGIRNRFNEPPLADMPPKCLETYFDECITTNKERPNDENYKLEFNYSFLVPPNYKLQHDTSKAPLIKDNDKNDYSNILTPEMDILLYMANHPDLKNLLKHPIITSFIYLKWRRISCIFFSNISFYVLFWLSLLYYILNDYNDLGKILTLIGLIVITSREFIQMLVSPKKYFTSIDNWIELLLIGVTYLLIFYQTSEPYRQQISSVVVLLSSAELVLLIGQFPTLSTNIVMLKTVSWNFFKFLLWYCILIIAFALSFYTLFHTVQNDKSTQPDENKAFNPNECKCEEEEENFFSDPAMSLFKTIVMLTGEFDASSIAFELHPITSHIIFVIFVFMIPIVLFNLLNGLAVSDTQAIKNDAELVGYISLIKLISYFESIFLGEFSFYNNTIKNMQNACCWLPGYTCINSQIICIRPLARRICLFPYFLPNAKICVKVNQAYEIEITKNKNEENDDVESSLCINRCSDIKMDKKIVKDAKNVINEKMGESSNEIKNLKKQLNKIEELLKILVPSNNK